MAIDVGTVRIGIARCDSEQIMSVPVETIASPSDKLVRIKQIISEFNPELIYVGKPISLSEKHTASTEMATSFAQELANLIQIPVRLLDERLTTVSAQDSLRSIGRNSKNTRSIIDQVAAVVLLDHAIALEKSSNKLAGELVSPRLETGTNESS